MSTVVELINSPINLNGAYRVAKWCVEFVSVRGQILRSAWSYEFYAGQRCLSINLSQQGFDTPLNRCQGQHMRICIYVVGHSQIIYSDWVDSYQPRAQYRFALPSSGDGPRVVNQSDAAPSSSLYRTRACHY
jgi:hypothetical protein